MNLTSLGRLIAKKRRARGLTLPKLAAQAGIGRSMLAALETGKLPELGFVKVVRICAAVGLVLEVREPELKAPLMSHRHLTEAAGRDLTKAAIEDVIVRGDIAAWRGLVRAIRARGSDRLARRVQDVVKALDPEDPKVRAFATLLPGHSAALRIGVKWGMARASRSPDCREPYDLTDLDSRVRAS